MGLLCPQPFVRAVFVSPPVAAFPPLDLPTLLAGLTQAAFDSAHGLFAKHRLDVFMHSSAQITQAQQQVDNTFRQHAAEIVSQRPGLCIPFLPSATQLLGPEADSKRLSKLHKQCLMQLELPLETRPLLSLLTHAQQGIAYGTVCHAFCLSSVCLCPFVSLADACVLAPPLFVYV